MKICMKTMKLKLVHVHVRRKDVVAYNVSILMALSAIFYFYLHVYKAHCICQEMVLYYSIYTCLYTEKTVNESASFTCDIPKDVMVNNLKWLHYPSGGQDPETLEIQERYIIIKYMYIHYL